MQRCSNAAYTMCPAQHLCGHVENAVFTEDSACAIFNAKVNGTVDQLPAKPDVLRTGDPCPLCGSPIQTTDPALLRMLTCLRDELVSLPELGGGNCYGSTLSGD